MDATTIHTSRFLSVAIQRNFGIISPWHQGKQLGVNELSHKQLKINLRNLDYGFIELRSEFVYMDDEAEKIGEEKFLFIPKVNLYDLTRLGNKYEQESILYKDKVRFELLDTDVGRVLSAFPMVFTKDELRTMYSEYFMSRNRNVSRLVKFSLEELRIPTLMESLHHLKIGAGLSETEWVKIL